MPELVIGEALPVFEDWNNQLAEFSFNRASYRGGHKYISSRDATGCQTLIQHPRETGDGYANRKRIAVVYNYVKPILNRYNDLVFVNDPQRDIELPIIEDVDGYGSTLNQIAKKSLLNSQIDGRSFWLLDSNIELPEFTSQASAQAMGARNVIRSIKAPGVPWYREKGNNTIVHAFCILEDEYEPFVLEVNEVAWRKIKVSDLEIMVVEEISPWKSHGYASCPLILIQPSDVDAQASSISEIQKHIFNLNSLLVDELYSSTYTQFAVSGCTVDDVFHVEKGTNRLLVINKPGVTFDSLGSDTNQATSIRESIADAIGELYRTAGVTAGNALDASAPMSGVALQFLQQGMTTHASALAGAIEGAENKLFNLLGGGTANYDQDFTPADVSTEMEEVIKAVESAMPKTIKKILIERFAKEAMNLSKEELMILDQELNNADVEVQQEENVPQIDESNI